jgi:hypothetical protein
MAVLLLLHVPPPAPSINVMGAPEHKVEAPEIVPAVAVAETVMICIAEAVPQPLVTE